MMCRLRLVVVGKQYLHTVRCHKPQTEIILSIKKKFKSKINFFAEIGIAFLSIKSFVLIQQLVFHLFTMLT